MTLRELMDEMMCLFEDYETDCLSIADFGLTYQGALLTHVFKQPNGILQWWSGDPFMDKHACAVTIYDVDELENIISEVVKYL